MDDDQGVRHALRRGLALEGFAVRDAADGTLALAEIAAPEPSRSGLVTSSSGCRW